MNSAIVRTLFGSSANRRYPRTIKQMRRSAKAKERTDIVLVFGHRNEEIAQELGFETRFMHGDCYPFKACRKRAWLWLNRIFALRKIMEEFDEIVSLDWDTSQVGDVPDDFWEVHRERDVFQSPLIRYTQRKALWRRGRGRKIIPNGGYVYCREPLILDWWFQLTKDMMKGDDEVALAKITDSMMGGWSKAKYCERFEPVFAHPRRTAISTEHRRAKRKIFRH